MFFHCFQNITLLLYVLFSFVFRQKSKNKPKAEPVSTDRQPMFKIRRNVYMLVDSLNTNKYHINFLVCFLWDSECRKLKFFKLNLSPLKTGRLVTSSMVPTDCPKHIHPCHISMLFFFAVAIFYNWCSNVHQYIVILLIVIFVSNFYFL